MKRKLLTLLLVIGAALACAFGLAACEKDDGFGEYREDGLIFFVYAHYDKVVRIEGCYGTATTIVIPSEFKGNPVTHIGKNAFSGCTGLTSITIPDSVTSIGSSAFEGCSGLTSITIPDSVTSIGSSAFSGCSSLTSITIPDSVTYIGEDAFSYCTGLTSVTIPEGVTSIGGEAFRDCSSLTSITIPDSVTEIDSTAFTGCPIETATIPAIAAKAIKNSAVQTVVITSGDTIGYKAFSGYTGLTSITIPDSVTSIGDYAFEGCSSLSEISFDKVKNLETIGENAFSGCESLTEIKLTKTGCTEIGDYAFSGCKNLISLTLPEKLEKLGRYAAKDCTSLLTAHIPSTVTDLGTGAYFGCESLRYISYPLAETQYNNVFPASVGAEVTINGGSKIPAESFKGCNISSISFPSKLTEIGDRAFYDCDGLITVILPNSLKAIGYMAFYDCNKLITVSNYTQMNIVAGNTSFGYVAAYAKTVTDTYANRLIEWDGFIFYVDTDKKYYLMGIEPFSLTDAELPDAVYQYGVKVASSYVIYDYAFLARSEITSITIPDCVTSIGEGAFGYCSRLTSVTVTSGNSKYHSAGNCIIETANKTLIVGCMTSIIPNNGSVTSIGSSAFKNCTGLTSITIPDSVTSIGEDAFWNCTGLTSLTIGNGVTSIGSYAFYNCRGLTSVTIGNSVTEIGSYAFEHCRSLASIKFEGTKAQWNAITKGGWWSSDTGNYTVQCTDGTLSKKGEIIL